MNKQTEEELEVGTSWEKLCTPIIDAIYECIDGSGLIVKCRRRNTHLGEFVGDFAATVITPSKKHKDCKKDVSYNFLRSSFRNL